MRRRELIDALPPLPSPLAPWMDDAEAALELAGFWRMFGGGGQCTVRWDGADRVWYGTVENVPGSSPNHRPDPCRLSPRRLDDFLLLADCRPISPHRWSLRYREPR